MSLTSLTFLLVTSLVALAPQLCWAADRYDEHEGFILASFIDKDWFKANSVRTAQRGAATTGYVCLEYTSGGILHEAAKSEQFCGAVEGLDLSHSTLTDRDVSSLAKLSKLKVLRLRAVKCNDNASLYNAINRVSSLRWLDIGEPLEGFGKEEIKTLSTLALTGISLVGRSSTSPEAVLGLQNPNATLRSINLSGCSNNLEMWRSVAALTGLEEIIARGDGTIIDEQTVEQILTMKGLRRIDISYARVAPLAFARLCELPYLDTLVCAGAVVPLSVAEAVAEKSHLRVCRMPNSVFVDNSLRALAAIKTLEKVDIAFSQGVHDEDVAGLMHSNNIKDLCVVGCEDVGPLTAAALSTSQPLVQLDISDTGLEADMLNFLPKQLLIEHLRCRGIAVDLQAARWISECKNLRTLDLSCCNLQDDALELIGSLPNLEALNLSSNPAGARPLADQDRFSALHTLRALDMENLDAETMSKIAGRPLTELQLEGRSMSSDTVRALAKSGTIKKLRIIAASNMGDSVLGELGTVTSAEEIVVLGIGESAATIEEKLSTVLGSTYILVRP